MSPTRGGACYEKKHPEFCTLSNFFAVRDVNCDMKIYNPTLLLLFATLFVSCDNDDVEPVKQRVILPLRMEQDDYKREFVFSGDNRVTTVKNFHYFPNDVVLETSIEYFYRLDKKLASTINTEGYRLVYNYDGEKLARTDEYLGDHLSQYHTFVYDDKDRLKEYTTWQDIPEYGGVVPKSKEVYVYDTRDNLMLQFLYVYNSATTGHDLLTSFEFSDYDGYPEAESLFHAHAFNPQAVFRKNNPGKMVTRNALGNIKYTATRSSVDSASRT